MIPPSHLKISQSHYLYSVFYVISLFSYIVLISFHPECTQKEHQNPINPIPYSDTRSNFNSSKRTIHDYPPQYKKRPTKRTPFQIELPDPMLIYMSKTYTMI